MRAFAGALRGALLGVLCLAGSVQAADTATLRGRVTAPDGTPLPGVFVTVRDGASGIESTVYSGVDGRYVLDGLRTGAIVVRAHHPRYAPGTRDTTLGHAGALADFTLGPASDPLLHAPTSHWFAHVPDDDMKREFILNCATCHEIGASRLLKAGAPRTRAEWDEAFALMKAIDVYAVLPPDFDAARYAEWLTGHFTPDAISRIPPPPVATPAVMGERVQITEYPVPAADELPHDLVVGPDGRIWITAFWHSEMWAMDPLTGAVETYAVNNQPDKVAQVRALEFDRKGRLWIVNGGTQSVVRLDPSSRRFDTFDVGMYAHDLVIDSRGDIWVNDYFAKEERIARIRGDSGEVSVFPLPSARLPASAGVPLPYGLQVDGKDRLWSSQLAANTLARYDIASGESHLYRMPVPNAGPRRMAIGDDGAVWVPEFNTGRLSRFDPGSETFTSFDTGIGAAGIYDVAVDPRSGDVWLGAALDSSLIRFEPASGRFTHYPLPTEPAYMRHLAIDPDTGDVWTAYSSLPTAVPKVVRLRRTATGERGMAGP